MASKDERAELAEMRVGATVKGWRLARLIGTGPITAAYEAYRGAKDAKERVVIKVMIGNIASHERAKSLFLRAAYAANRFEHARVLPILEDGTDEKGTPFVVRPWTDARPLAEVALDSQLDEKTVLRMAEQVLDALEMAHAHGILHGALTPTNILITERKSIRLCDFATPPGMGTSRTSEDDVLTKLRAGPFLAPERSGALAQPASEAGDIYSLAASLYFALTKAPPLVDARVGEARGFEARPVRELAPKVSEHFAMILAHALSSDPLRRYESAYAMLGDVRRAMAGRKPKLGDAMSPVSSQGLSSATEVSAPSSHRMPASNAARAAKGSPALASIDERKRREWRGNVLLVLLIALLVGIATFVLVREKVAEERDRHGKEDPRKEDVR